MYRMNKRNTDRAAVLLTQENKLFHTNDLALLWGMENRNTLYTTIKRYLQKGILFPIHKGFYAVVPLNKINPILLGMGLLHQYGYLTTESVLIEEGLIHQDIGYITYVSSISKRFNIGNEKFLVRKMQDRYLYQTEGIIDGGEYKKATPERAIADLLYFNPSYHIDERQLIDWEKVKFIQKEVGFR